MSSIVVAGDTSGSVTISAPAVAGTPTLTLPTTSGTIITTASTTGLDASVISSGTMATARLASGSATSSTYLRGDQTWATISSGATTLKFVTDSTDIAISATPPSTYYNVGSSFSVSIPTTGIIRIASFVGKINNNNIAQGAGITFGIRISSTNYWLGLVDGNGTAYYYQGVADASAIANTTFYGALSSNSNGMYAKPQCLDIAVNSIPTGTQTVQLIVSKTNSAYTDNFTIKGTSVTTKVGIEFVSAS